ncbi:hypothetical protein NMG60_11006238 [Bertholletia excelsa]
MKHQANEPPNGRNKTWGRTSTVVILVSLTLILFTVVPLYHPLPSGYFFTSFARSSHSSSRSGVANLGTKCHLFAGEWVPNPAAPYYTNTTCWAIHEHQNCMKHGRPDSGFLKWRWKPHGCELPIFDPTQFLETVRGKSLAFVGDSVTRNQMQSLICLLSRIAYPVDASYTSDDFFRRWKYPTHNFTIAAFWTPYLVRSREADTIGPTHNGLFDLYLDEPDTQWTAQIADFDYVIISSGHRIFRPLVYYQQRRVVGCTECGQANVTHYSPSYGYRRIFRTAFKAINDLAKFKGTVFLRTFAPSHFEGGEWNTGGKCLRTTPFKSGEVSLNEYHAELYRSQVEEFKLAEREGRKRGLKFRLLDTTPVMLLRPDGHPFVYGHWPNDNVTLYNDCIHWCLPGPIDAWNDLLLEMLKMEKLSPAQE